MYDTAIIEANTLGEAWEKAVVYMYKHGHKRYVQAPEYQIETRDLPMMIKVKEPFKEPRISKLAEDTEEALKDYTQYTIFGYKPGKEKEFEYTYHSRLRCYPDCKVRAWLPAVSENEKELKKQVRKVIPDGKCVVQRIDQVEAVIKTLKKDPTRRTCVMHTWIPYRDLMKFGPRREDTSSPCLLFAYPQLVDGKLHMFCTMKTNDLYNAWPGNAYAFTALQKYMADKIGVGTGTYTHFSVSMHIYKDKFEEVKEKFGIR